MTTYSIGEETVTVMALRIRNGRRGDGLKSRIDELSGVTIDGCLQCKRCSNGCPVTPSTGLSPAEIIKRLQLGAGDELLDNEIIWICVSCSTCFARCPMGIDMAAVMDALRVMAVENGAAKPEGNMPLMNRLLLQTVKTFGRTYDLGAMLLYKVGTATYLKDTEKFPTLLKKRKIALLPSRGADTKRVKGIFKKFETAKEDR